MSHKILRPERFSVLPNTSGADKSWLHWKRTFTSYLASAITTPTAPTTEGSTTGTNASQGTDKLDVLINFVSTAVYDYISECANYESAIATLESLYVVPKHDMFARHLLNTRKQKPDESLDTFLNQLKLLAKECQFKAVSAEVYKDEQIRDAFIDGLISPNIRQRLLENTTLTLTEAVTQARSLELAQKTSEQYNNDNNPNTNPITVNAANVDSFPDEDTDYVAAVDVGKTACWFCGGPRHHRSKCPAKDSICYNCDTKGHLGKVCQKSKKKKRTTAPSASTTILASAITAGIQAKTVVKASIARNEADALIDTGSLGSSLISKALVVKLKLDMKATNTKISMAQSTLAVNIKGCVTVDLTVNGTLYEQAKLLVMDALCTDIIIGTDILGEHDKVVVEFGGSKP